MRQFCQHEKEFYVCQANLKGRAPRPGLFWARQKAYYWTLCRSEMQDIGLQFFKPETVTSSSSTCGRINWYCPMLYSSRSLEQDTLANSRLQNSMAIVSKIWVVQTLELSLSWAETGLTLQLYKALIICFFLASLTAEPRALISQSQSRARLRTFCSNFFWENSSIFGWTCYERSAQQ